MANNYRTARGIPIDMDRLRLANETSIAVGNMKVNARGDLLGDGGKIVKTRAQIMAEKNKLHNGPIADDFEVFENLSDNEVIQPDLLQVQPSTLQPAADDTPIAESVNKEYTRPRGSFAEAVAQQTEVVQELLDPNQVLKNTDSQPGIKRI